MCAGDRSGKWAGGGVGNASESACEPERDVQSAGGERVDSAGRQLAPDESPNPRFVAPTRSRPKHRVVIKAKTYFRVTCERATLPSVGATVRGNSKLFVSLLQWSLLLFSAVVVD
jgi:hypothetical protein